MKPLLPEIVVNGEVIPAALIATEAQNHPAPKSKPGLAWMAAARALAVRALLLQEARRRGLAPDPQEITPGQFETDDEALVRQLLDLAVQPKTPSEADLRRVHAANPDLFRAPSLYEAAHILFPVKPGDTAALDQAQAQAAAVLAALQADPRAFGQLARDHSACTSRANGGRLGQISAGDTVAEFEAALASMTEGEITTAPVLSRYGLHIIRLDARAIGEVLPFEAIAGQLRSAQEKTAWVRASAGFIASLVAVAQVSGIALRAA